MVDLKDIDFDQFDGVLVMTPDSVNEAGITVMGNTPGDIRATSAKIGPEYDKGAYSNYLYYQDPKLYASWAFGKVLQGSLTNIGSGFSSEVADFGKYVVARVSYSNPPTGKSATKTFLITFDPDGKTGNVFQNSNRYRSFSGVSQAAAHIKSCVSSLKDKTN